MNPDSNPQNLEHLIELAAFLGQQNDYQEMLRVVTEKANALLHADFASILMINPQTRNTVKTISRRGEQGADAKQHKIHLHVSGWIIKNKRPFLSGDIRSDTRFAKHLFRDLEKVAVIGAPFLSEGRVIGALILGKEHTRYLQLENELHYLENYAAVAAPFLHKVQDIQMFFEPPIRENALVEKYKEVGLLGRSKQFIELLHAVEAAARCDVRVMLEGESGTGKELIARAIHRFSARCNGPFVAIDCGAIPENLVESELFGHVKGAFTGADTAHTGLIESANNGTFFLDEVANLPIPVQAKLMRVLQEGELRPVGSNRAHKVDVRIISASSSSLQGLVAEGRFREDLYYRLHVYPIQVPSLDERRDDIPLLANRFLKRFAGEQGKKAETFHEDVIDFVRQRQWRGNIRELENFIERLVVLCPPEHTVLGREALPKNFLQEMKKLEVINQDRHVTKSLRESIAEYEEQVIRQALARNDWNRAKTARVLKISAETLRYKMKNLGIARSSR